jgi:hypothetical protein
MSSEDDDIRLSSCVAPTETDGIAATGTILRAPASAGRETIGEAPVAVAAARGTPLRIASSEGTVVGLIIGFWIFIPREKSFFFRFCDPSYSTMQKMNCMTSILGLITSYD